MTARNTGQPTTLGGGEAPSRQTNGLPSAKREGRGLPVQTRGLFGLLFAAFAALPTFGSADSVDGRWTILSFTGEQWFVDAKSLEHLTQSFSGGFASGPLYSCENEGQSMTYNIYSNDAFFENPEFDSFLPLRNDMTLSSNRLFVHRITCNGRSPEYRRVLYPFVTNEARASAWYLYEGGVFTLYRP